MTAAQKLNLISVEDYLAGELVSPVKHEYLGGVVHAMAGARNLHNIVAGNVFASLHTRLRGRRCRPFNSDTKIRVRLPTQWRFYYPDVSVIGRPNPPDDSYQDDAAVIVEVLSKATRRIDEGEKKDAYLTIPSLFAYILVEQECCRRGSSPHGARVCPRGLLGAGRYYSAARDRSGVAARGSL
jgi:Uma2 family endonuclease